MEYPKITSVMLVLTHACNLRCRYCFVHKEPETMSYSTAKDAVDFVIANCEHGETPSINFFGGEPMLCWDSIIVPLTKYIREERNVPFQLSMTTNGTLLNAERIRFMREYRIGMLFSIDGDIDTQDYNRPYADGSGSFASLKDLIPVIAKEFHPTFRMTTIPATCGNLFHDIMFADQSGFTSFFVIPNVFEAWDDVAWDTLRREMRKYSDYCIACYRGDKTPIVFSEFEKALHNISRINAAIDRGEFRENCEACQKCGLGTNRFASVHPSGDLYACQEMTSNDGCDSPFWIGNIYSGVDNDRRVQLASMLIKDKMRGPNCDQCRLRRICDGGCVANNYLANGDINHMPDIFCYWHQLLLDEAIYVMRELANAPRFIQLWRTRYGNQS